MCLSLTSEDVLLSKAKEGVKIQIIVWAHRILSVINRLLYLGEISIDREVAKLQSKAEKLGLKVEVFHEYSGKPVRAKFATRSDLLAF